MAEMKSTIQGTFLREISEVLREAALLPLGRLNALARRREGDEEQHHRDDGEDAPCRAGSRGPG